MLWVRMLALGSLVFLTLPAQAARHPDATTMTIRLISTETDAKVITDRAPQNETSRGDVVLVGSTLRNAVAQLGRPKGAVVGQDTVIFKIISTTRAEVTVESKLPGGWLLAGGRVRLGHRQAYPVTGGSGSYEGARGTGQSVALGPSRVGRLKVYRLVLR
jgi:hypothetical protein